MVKRTILARFTLFFTQSLSRTRVTEVVIGDNEANEMRESANMVVNRIKTSGVCRTVDITLKNSITTHFI